jgi:hypothetical protein
MIANPTCARCGKPWAHPHTCKQAYSAPTLKSEKVFLPMLAATSNFNARKRPGPFR